MSESSTDFASTETSGEGLLPQLVKHLRQNRTALREEWGPPDHRGGTADGDDPGGVVLRGDRRLYDNYVEVLETGSVEALQALCAVNLSERIIPRGVETDEVLGIVLLAARRGSRGRCSRSTRPTSTC